MSRWRGRVELWSDVEAAGGIRLAVIGGPLGLTERRDRNGEHTVTLTTEFDHPAVRTLDTPAGDINFRTGHVIRLVREGDSQEWTEHRIAIPQRRVVGSQRTWVLTAHSILEDLGKRGSCERYLGDPSDIGQRLVSFSLLGLTLTEHWQQVIYPALRVGGQPWWEFQLSGAAEDLLERPVDLVYDKDTPLSALRKLLAAPTLGGLELSVHGTAEQYTVVVQRQIGEDAAPVMAMARGALRGLTYTETEANQATRIFPVGSPSGVQSWVRDTVSRAEEVEARAVMGEAEWGLTGAEPVRTAHPTLPGMELLTLRLVDPAGGPGPIQFDRQFVQRPGDGTRFLLDWVTAARSLEIDVTDAETQAVGLRVAPGEVVPSQLWHRVRIVQMGRYVATGQEGLSFLDNPDAVDKYGVLVGHLEVPDVPPTTNVLLNPIMRDWPAHLTYPFGWSGFGAPTVSRRIDPGDWVTGGQALRAVLTSPSQAVFTPTALLSYKPRGLISFFVRLKVLSGSVRVLLTLTPVNVHSTTGQVTSTAGTAIVVPDDIFASDPQFPDVIKNSGLGIWQDIGVAAAVEIPATADYWQVGLAIRPTDKVTAVQNNTFILDAAQVTNTPEQRPLLDGSAGTRLWHAANERLVRYAEPAVTVDANLLDFADLDPDRHPYDSFVLGGEVRLIDQDAEVDVTTRIAGWERDWLARRNTRISVSSTPDRITRVLAQRPGTHARGR